MYTCVSERLPCSGRACNENDTVRDVSLFFVQFHFLFWGYTSLLRTCLEPKAAKTTLDDSVVLLALLAGSRSLPVQDKEESRGPGR